MPFETLNGTGNNKFPATFYENAVGQEASKYGASIGCDNQDTYKIEYVYLAGDTNVAATEFASTFPVVIPEGYIIESVKVDASTTFNGALTVGHAQKSDGTGSDADSLYTGTPTVGTSEDGTLVSPLDEVLENDIFVISNSSATAGKCKVVITVRNAIADID